MSSTEAEAVPTYSTNGGEEEADIARDRNAVEVTFWIRRHLGSGTYTSVFEAESQLTHRRYAMKRYRFDGKADAVQTSLLKDLAVAATTTATATKTSSSSRDAAIVTGHFVRHAHRHAYVFLDLHCVSLEDVLIYVSQRCLITDTKSKTLLQRWRDDGRGGVTDPDDDSSELPDEAPLLPMLPLPPPFFPPPPPPQTPNTTTGAAAATAAAQQQQPEVVVPQKTAWKQSVPAMSGDGAVIDSEPIIMVIFTREKNQPSPPPPLSTWWTRCMVRTVLSTEAHGTHADLLVDKMRLLETYIDPLCTFQEQFQRSFLPAVVVLTWFQQCLAGLLRMYARGWAHGDVKPANVMMDLARQHAHLIDFNVSQPLVHTLDRFEYPTWCFAPLEYFHTNTNCIASILHASSVEAWTAGCLLLMLVVQRPMLLSHHAMRNYQESTHKQRDRFVLLQNFWTQAGLFPSPDPNRLRLAFPELSLLLPSFVVTMLCGLLHPDPLRRASLFMIHKRLDDMLHPSPSSSMSISSSSSPSSTSSASASSSTSSSSSSSVRLSVRPFEEQTSADLRFNAEYLTWTEQAVSASFRRSASTWMLHSRAVEQRACVLRDAVDQAQLLWLTSVPLDTDPTELVILAIHFFDNWFCQQEQPPPSPSTSLSTQRLSEIIMASLLLAERLVFNASIGLTQRGRIVGRDVTSIVTDMLDVALTVQQHVYPPTLYGLMRFLVEIQFGLWWPHACTPNDFDRTKYRWRYWSWRRGQDAMLVLQALLFDASIFHLQPIQLCLAVWWVCQHEWTSALALHWDGRLRPALQSWLEQQNMVHSAIDVWPSTLGRMGSNVLVPAMWSLLRANKLPLTIQARLIPMLAHRRANMTETTGGAVTTAAAAAAATTTAAGTNTSTSTTNHTFDTANMNL